MATFFLKIITSNKVFFKGQVSLAVVTATDGEKAFMAHHEEMVLALKPGEIRFQRRRYLGDSSIWCRCCTGSQ